MTIIPFPDPSQITELLSKTIADAHARTCLYSLEHIHNMFRKPQDVSKLMYYKDMVSFVLILGILPIYNYLFTAS